MLARAITLPKINHVTFVTCSAKRLLHLPKWSSSQFLLPPLPTHCSSHISPLSLDLSLFKVIERAKEALQGTESSKPLKELLQHSRSLLR